MSKAPSSSFAKLAALAGMRKLASSIPAAPKPTPRTPPASTPRQSSALSLKAAQIADANLAAMLKAAGGVPTTPASSTDDYLATPERVIQAGKVRRSGSQITTSNVQALRILAAAEFARGEHSTEVPLPADAVARAIVLAARKRDQQ
jgi:hypothetical protein